MKRKILYFQDEKLRKLRFRADYEYAETFPLQMKLNLHSNFL